MTQQTNTFALRSDQYVQARPRYPRALFEWLARQATTHDAAWDCATGNGQAAVGLAPFFRSVQATDVSAEQVGEGLPAPNVVYSAAPAEHTPFETGSFDLVTVAQALHWFDYDRFWPEVRRVARPGALFSAWGYAWFDTDAAVIDSLVAPVREIILPYWARNNRILWDGYRDEDTRFPFQRIAVPTFSVEEHWTIDQVAGYLQTWSAYKKAHADAANTAALDALVDTARQRFAAAGKLRVTMPLSIVAGRV